MPKLFAVCAPGLELFTAQEIIQLGLLAKPSPSPVCYSAEKKVGEEVGGVEFSGSLREIYRANLHLRTANRVWVNLRTFFASTFSELRRRASRLPWEDYLSPGQAVTLRVTCRKSRLFHSGGVMERVAEAIAVRLGEPPVVQKFIEDAETNLPQLILVRIVENRCTISLDSSGDLLHRRGYRLDTAKAPLRETLAAAMLLASHWEPTSPLLDPFCGSGTIAIEAAMMARKIMPGQSRRFAFMDWPNFDRALWASLPAEGEAIRGSTIPRIIASDRDAGAIRASKANAERAGVADCIDFTCRAVSAMETPLQPGWVITNPPYGVRISTNKDLRNLYAQFGKILRAKCPGWQVAMLCNSAQLLRCTGLPFDEGIPLLNGGLKVRLVKGKVE